MNSDKYKYKSTYYYNGRPGYPKKLYQFLKRNLDIQNQNVVDMGAGTGILSQNLLENNNFVYLVEPNIEMLKLAKKALKFSENKILYNCYAENTCIPSNTIDTVIAAQSYHWFDNKKIKLEIERILKNKGLVVLIWNELKSDTPITQSYKNLLKQYSNYDPNLDDILKYQKQIEFDFNKTINTEIFEHSQNLNHQEFIERVLSSSFSPNNKNAQFPQFLNDIKHIFSKHSKNGIVTMFLQTHLFYFYI
ncbi:class I SAM-dependent methyltransferase [Staphylococcus gallinarum]|uniref:class I SAM-dependent methyltransferase n=1 Tax=Staphylococcus gallinarum TaxID=1293 RepID=UPI002DB6C1EE|nr:class I SAM-dependent methyltransferase [Staphylococcus gallinarum]MEB7040094.1 class I SAM-dependent methyltransferase [Staphylococcus gallinarum]